MKKISRSRLVSLSVGTVVMAAPLLALAANMDAGSVASNVTSNFSNISKVITGGAYVIGAAAVLHGVHRWWQKAHDNNGQIKASSIFTPIGAGGAMIAIAATAGVPVASMFGTSTSNGSDSGTTSY